MFLDLCLEIYMDEAKNSKVIKTIEKQLIYLKKKKKIPKGFKTGLDSCKLYLSHIQEFLLH